MTIWRGNSHVPSIGPKFHVQWAMLGGMDAHETDTASAVVEARKVLSYVKTGMDAGYKSFTDSQQAYLDKYFVLGSERPSEADFDEITKVLLLTHNGMFAAGLKVKISNTAASGGFVTAGYVTRHKNPRSDSVLKTRGNHAGMYSGNIHLHQSELNTPRSAVRTIIHEATHRYAGTGDFGEQGYTDGSLSLNFRQAGLTNAQALNNAESYAAFAIQFFYLR